MPTTEKPTTEVEKKPTPDAPKPLLELSTIPPDREILTIDGEPYEYRNMSEFGIEESQQISAEGAEFDKLWQSTEPLNKRDKVRLKLLLTHLFDKALDAPKEVKDRCNDELRQQVIQGFFLVPLKRAVEKEERERESQTDPSTGEN